MFGRDMILPVGFCFIFLVEPTIADADLQNLVACARLKLPDLTADQIAAVAVAIKHAEAELEARKKAAAIPVEVKK